MHMFRLSIKLSVDDNKTMRLIQLCRQIKMILKRRARIHVNKKKKHKQKDHTNEKITNHQTLAIVKHKIQSLNHTPEQFKIVYKSTSLTIKNIFQNQIPYHHHHHHLLDLLLRPQLELYNKDTSQGRLIK